MVSELSKPFHFVLGILIIVALFTGCTDEKTAEDHGIIKEDGKVINPDRGIYQDEELPIEFDLVDTIDLSLIDEPLISSIGFLSLDDSDNLYFFDRQLMMLISVDQNGNLRWATGQEGKGPGDFETVLGMALHNERIYISNIMGSRLDEFDMDGNFIRSYNMPSELQFAGLAGIKDNGEFVTSSAKFGTIGTDVAILELSSDSLNITNQFSIIESQDDDFLRATSRGSLTLKDDQLAYSFSLSNGHRFYDYDSTMTMEVTRAFEGALGPGVYASGNSVSMYSLGSVGSPIFLDDGSYLINVRFPVNISDPNEYARKASTGETEDPIYEEFIDIYNANHELLYVYDNTEEIEALGALNIRDSEGLYYSTFSNDLLIKKFRVGLKAEYFGSESENPVIPID